MDHTVPDEQESAGNQNDTRPSTPEQDLSIVTRLEKRVEYDTKQLRDFLDLVFHGGIRPGEYVLGWSTKARPGLPMAAPTLIKRLERTHRPRALYYGTATTRLDDQGQLRNKQSLFGGLHVIVLDDIGTKVKRDDLPEALKDPTYIIESSEGNFQYGYVLDEPIRDLEAARALVSLLYSSGYGDSGGALACKLVRLPGGVNGKPGEKGNFEVKLHDMSGPYWKPQSLLDAVDCKTTWAEIQANALEAMKQRTHKRRVTEWSPIKINAATAEGYVDPVLEWLYEQGHVVQERNDWVDIICPWCDGHTDPNEKIAGYSPLGWGDGAYRTRRAFHCFHDHCAANKTGSLLAWVQANGGPEVGISDCASELLAQWVYDDANDFAWDVTGEVPYGIPLKNFKNRHPHDTFVFSGDGKTHRVPEVTMWLKSPLRVTVAGTLFDPTTTASLTEFEGRLRVNLCRTPDWGKPKIVQEDIAMFTRFLEYLIPATAPREYFLCWLAAKAQNMGFRGAAILMVAPKQGVGRTTLTHMITEIFGRANAADVPFEKLIANNNFNEWQESPFVFSNETLNIGNRSAYYRAYESLKDLADPRPREVMINEKFLRPRKAVTYASYLLMSNHEDALQIPETDRRIKVIRNAYTPNTPEYFTRLNKWMQESQTWQRSIWHWLRQKEVDLEELAKPVPFDEAKEDMVRAGESVLDKAIRVMIACWEGPYFSQHIANELLEGVIERLDLPSGWKRQLPHAIRRHTDNIDLRAHWFGTRLRVRVIQGRARIVPEHAESVQENMEQNSKTQIRNRFTDMLAEYDL